MLVLTLVALSSETAFAGVPPIVVPTQAQVTVVTPLSLVKVVDMSFGRIIPATSGGTVTVSPINDACTKTGPIVEISTCRAARFAGRGARKMLVRFSVSSIVNLTGPGQAMVLDTITFNNDSTLTYTPNGNGNGNGNQRYTIEDPSGIYALVLGGTLHVNANQASGSYTGSITLTVQYN